MSDLALHPILGRLAEILADETTRGCYPCGPPADITPEAPYTVLWTIGGNWDQGPLEQGAQAAHYGLQVDGVGRTHEDVAAVLDVAREVLLHSDLRGDGWRCSGSYSEGLPVPLETAQRLRSSAERFTLYVCAD